MGKQKAHRRAQAQAQAEQQVNPGGDRVIRLLDDIRQPATTSVASTAVQDRPASTPVTVQPPVVPAATSQPQFPRGERKPNDTVAGQSKYDRYFGLYARAVREGRTTSFRSLGFIPGSGIVIEKKDDKIRILMATPDAAEGIGPLPTDWMIWGELPEGLRKILEEIDVIATTLTHSPSPWHLRLAQNLLSGKLPPEHLTMVMTHFRYRAGDPERQFGITLIPVTGGVKIERVYNPQNMAEVPGEGTVLTPDQLKDSAGPVQKLLRTWALMEDNYSMRYDRDGNRLANGGYRPPQQRQAVAQTASAS